MRTWLSLLRLEDETGRTHAVEVGNSTLIPLDGSASQIGLANEMAGLRLNIDNVLAYAMFFCGFLEIREGEVCSFVTSCGNWYLDTGVIPQDLTPKVEESRDGSKAYMIHAYLAVTGGLFLAVLKVEQDGVVSIALTTSRWETLSACISRAIAGAALPPRAPNRSARVEAGFHTARYRISGLHGLGSPHLTRARREACASFLALLIAIAPNAVFSQGITIPQETSVIHYNRCLNFALQNGYVEQTRENINDIAVIDQ